MFNKDREVLISMCDAPLVVVMKLPYLNRRHTEKVDTAEEQ